MVTIFVKSIEGNGKGREEKEFFKKKVVLLYDNNYKNIKRCKLLNLMEILCPWITYKLKKLIGL